MPFKEGVKRMFQRFRSTDQDIEGTSSREARRPPKATCRSAEYDPYDPQNMKLVRTIGTGSYGRVFWARIKGPDGDLTAETVAVKRLTKSSLIKQKQVNHIRQEKSILAQLQHPMVVRLLNTFQDECYLYIVLEFVPGGEFFTYLRKVKRLLPDAARFYAACVASLFEYMHSLDILYRDLKPENLLLDTDGYIKMTDFGFAKHVPERTYTLCGTPEYVAPEVLLNKGHGKSVDWWTLGILIYEMIAGYTPYTDDDVMQIYQRILAGKILFPKGFDPDAKSLVKHLLQHDLSKRYGTLREGAESIKKHRFISPIDFDDLYNRELEAPYVPVVVPASADNFNTYSESNEKPIPIQRHEDPFLDW
ncbi:putative CAMP-dependent protein kinase catalytic subunit [Gregarina niphandrodes]|uniref:cAMP-dependent protein kinase catalytic subunit n=1 Tax=Gregarina niphandrodes TaxID=110365 RepID=A0A023B177_GRENI|nr:putative CAMP-dependent protein kinase catalytic subunit [Gregarina niphandrodes]EZG46763.1 putative CAMP-dependent protein kinase catalytic subunit [Gregarina niphandrodes]|eukprot:XP_011132272.1 putative CAMP-dependent protein kinase catalytic subunit [Gregarina niphandrodes]